MPFFPARFFLTLIIWQIILFIKNSSRLTSSIHSHHYYRHRPIFIPFFIVIYNMLNNLKNENFFYLKIFVYFLFPFSCYVYNMLKNFPNKKPISRCFLCSLSSFIAPVSFSSSLSFIYNMQNNLKNKNRTSVRFFYSLVFLFFIFHI